jgi:hypothetical protein
MIFNKIPSLSKKVGRILLTFLPFNRIETHKMQINYKSFQQIHCSFDIFKDIIRFALYSEN